MRNSSHLLSRRTRALRVLRARLGELNSAVSAKRNIQHHYDIDTPVYRLFLDQDLHYSCAYFEQPELSLEAAQQAKCALIARKLDLRPGAHVLDIGCGWGSNALYLARHFDVEVTGGHALRKPMRHRPRTRRGCRPRRPRPLPPGGLSPDAGPV